MNNTFNYCITIDCTFTAIQNLENFRKIGVLIHWQTQKVSILQKDNASAPKCLRPESENIEEEQRATKNEDETQ